MNTRDESVYHLTLYVADATPRSIQAFTNIKKICDDFLPGKCRIEVIDLIENPNLATRDQILAIPTLIRKHRSPLRKIIGDLSNTERVLEGLKVPQTS